MYFCLEFLQERFKREHSTLQKLEDCAQLIALGNVSNCVCNKKK